HNYTHTHSHTNTRTHYTTHTHTHTQTHTYTLHNTHAHMNTHIHITQYTHTHINTHIHMYTHTHSAAPLKQKKVLAKQKAPWRNEEIIKLKRSCRRSERTWKKTKLQVHLDIFKDKLSVFNKAIRNARKDHFSNLI